MSKNFETRILPQKQDYLAPDGSEIRLLPKLRGGGMAHCSLPPGKTSSAVYHKTVEELWYFISGEGQVWRKLGEKEEVVEVHEGVCVSIPVGTTFQFRNSGEENLCFIIATMPPWPGPEEAAAAPGKWE